jgi:prepilin-type N-terminal cleavage/methylation domain-containing protein
MIHKSEGFAPFRSQKPHLSTDTKNIRLLTGFTLIEVIVTIAIFTIISMGVIALISELFSNSQRQSSLLVGSDQARKIGFWLVTELRNACMGVDGSYSVGTASDQAITFYSDNDNDGSVEKIRYYIQNQKLFKGTTEPQGSVYNPAQEKNVAVLDDLANGNLGQPIFYYFDGTHDGTTDNHLTQPINVTQVKFVKVNLIVYKKGGFVNTSTYTVTAGAAIRNLKTNLGE